MTGDQNKTLALLDEVIRDLERMMRDSSDIGIDRARIALVLANCRRVRAALMPPPSGAPGSGSGSAGPRSGDRSGGLDCIGALRPD
jgi:hypothetical protein